MIVQRLFRLVETYKIAQRARIVVLQTFRTSLNRYWANKLLVNSSITSLSLWGFVKKSETDDNTITTRKVILAKVDALYENREYDEIHMILNKYRDDKDVEYLWRQSRALYYMTKTANNVEARKMINEAYNLIMEANSIDSNHWAVHKWIAVLLDHKSQYDGMKERIKQLYTVKEHIVEATRLNPNDATSLFMLGKWCYSVADLAWYQRKIASAIFGEVPESSYEEALQYFEAAERINPMFYSQNLLLLGKTYLKLQRKDDAIKYFKMTAEYAAQTDEDHEAKQEATKILGTI